MDPPYFRPGQTGSSPSEVPGSRQSLAVAPRNPYDDFALPEYPII
jgi:hypothetical protein